MAVLMDNGILLLEESACRELRTGFQRRVLRHVRVCGCDCLGSFHGVGQFVIKRTDQLHGWLLRIIDHVLEHIHFIVQSVLSVEDFDLSLSFCEKRLFSCLILYLKGQRKLRRIQSLKLFMVCRFAVIHIVNNVFPLFCRKLLKPFGTVIVDLRWPLVRSGFTFLDIDQLEVFWCAGFVRTFLLILTFIFVVRPTSFFVLRLTKRWTYPQCVLANGPLRNILDIFFRHHMSLDRALASSPTACYIFLGLLFRLITWRRLLHFHLFGFNYIHLCGFKLTYGALDVVAYFERFLRVFSFGRFIPLCFTTRALDLFRPGL